MVNSYDLIRMSNAIENNLFDAISGFCQFQCNFIKNHKAIDFYVTVFTKPVKEKHEECIKETIKWLKNTFNKEVKVNYKKKIYRKANVSRYESAGWCSSYFITGLDNDILESLKGYCIVNNKKYFTTNESQNKGMEKAFRSELDRQLNLLSLCKIKTCLTCPEISVLDKEEAIAIKDWFKNQFGLSLTMDEKKSAINGFNKAYELKMKDSDRGLYREILANLYLKAFDKIKGFGFNEYSFYKDIYTEEVCNA